MFTSEQGDAVIEEFRGIKSKLSFIIILLAVLVIVSLVFLVDHLQAKKELGGAIEKIQKEFSPYR